MSALLFRLSCLQDAFMPVLPADISKPDEKIFFPWIKVFQLRVCSPAPTPEWAGVGNSRKIQGNQTNNTLMMDSYSNLWGRIRSEGLSRVSLLRPAVILMRLQMWKAVPPRIHPPVHYWPPLQHHQPGWLMLQQGFLHTITRLSHYSARCEPAVIPREKRAPMENRPSLVLSSKSGYTVMGCEWGPHLWMWSPYAIPLQSI